MCTTAFTLGAKISAGGSNTRGSFYPEPLMLCTSTSGCVRPPAVLLSVCWSFCFSVFVCLTLLLLSWPLPFQCLSASSQNNMDHTLAAGSEERHVQRPRLSLKGCLSNELIWLKALKAHLLEKMRRGWISPVPKESHVEASFPFHALTLCFFLSFSPVLFPQ